MTDQLQTQPPPTTFLTLTFPSPRVVLCTMTRPHDLNCTSSTAILEMTRVFRWIDDEPNLSVAILTGAGSRAFSTGADLKEWNAKVAQAAAEGKPTAGAGPGNVEGAEALSNRRGKKVWIAAVNGMALGGGCENVVNCDLVIASETATFGLVEVKRGLAAYAGALPRLIRTIGLQRASEFALTGKIIDAFTAEKWGLVNKVVPQGEVVAEAVRWAEQVAENSPDSLVVTRAGLREGWTTADAVEATRVTDGREWQVLQAGENMQEGLRAFRERRKPVWKGAKL